MLAAHMDQIGFLVHDINANGCLRFTAVGGLIPFTLIGQRVVINDTVMGAIGVDIDLEAGGDLSKAKVSQMYIDIGATSKEDAGNKVKVGDLGNFQSEFYENADIVMSRVLDNRISCYMLIQLIKEGLASPYDIYYAFTCQEETGTYGAITASYGIEPHYGLSLDITPAGDLPGTKNSTASLGQGIGIKLMDPSWIMHPEIKQILTQAAEREGIKYQYEVMKRGGTDAGPMQTARMGVKTGSISVTTRNAHTANEIISKSDVEEGIRLLRAVLTTA
jgi:putative aminopeptidase FrvX